MEPVKKQLEILLLQYFRECYPHFPKGKVLSSESPDFIIKLKSKNNIGIELTRLNPVNAKVPDKAEHKQHEIHEHIINLAKSIFENTSDFRLFIKFLFSEKNHIKPGKEMIVAIKAVNAIREAIKDTRADNFFYISVNKDSLPADIAEILIVNHPVLKNSVWERSNNLGISLNVLNDIRESLNKKDEKLRLYQKQRLNYYWLLITCDKLQGFKNFNLPDKITNHIFNSRFQQVFLFDIIKSSVIRLV